MKLIYLTDIHGAFSQVATLLSETVADIYIVAGDLIDIPFYDIDAAIRYHELQTELWALRARLNRNDEILEDFVDSLLEKPDVSEDIIEKGTRYQEYTIRARRVMQQKYKVLENHLSFKTSAAIYALPGNYDMDLKYTSLHERDLHLHWHAVDGLRIAGYGGADVWTAGIPQRYIVRYESGIGAGDGASELYRFFRAVRPDIIVAHQPAHGVMDRLSFKGPSGSPALRTYCDNHGVRLCLTGHVHADWGLRESEGTLYLNPSNFGDVTTGTGDVAEGGFFYAVNFEAGAPAAVTLHKLVEDRIYDIAAYRKEAGSWTEDVIDSERLDARRLYRNYDMKTKKYSHIPEIELFKEIKKFYRLFQTQETEDRVTELEKAVEMMKDRFEDVAMDIVGSVNLGISQKSSDIDIVLYLRCDSNCRDLNEQCEYYQRVKRSIAECLGSRYRFEIIDCINLNQVERSVITRNFECETTQRFVAYRSICRPVNYKVIAPIEDILNEDPGFRREMEGSIRSYFRIFATTSQHMRSFDKYESRLKSIGIKLPESIREKIRQYLQVTNSDNLHW